jgi:6-pyruvoyltetrahydropterin/6-carboxytetrahydropterin synthase
MPTTKISKELRWEGAHRLVGDQGLCRHIHGHSFRLRISVEAPVDKVGMGFAFGKIKATMQDLIDNKLDHALILWAEDPLLHALASDISRRTPIGAQEPTDAYVALKDVYSRVYAVPKNPTSENLAEHFWGIIEGRLPEGVTLSELWFAETKSCAVTITADHIHKLPEQ